MTAAKPSGFQSVSYSAPPAFIASPVSVSSQYHAQDSLGQYSYGYSAGSSAKAETKTVDGVTRGGYSYLDGNGVVQTTNYVADDVHGFRVAATNLPTHVAYDTPEVAAAKLAHSVAYNEAAYAAAASPDVGESVVVSAPVVTSYVSSPALSVVKEVPFKASSYSAVVASPSAIAVPTVAPLLNVVKEVPSKAFSYSTVEASPSVATTSLVNVKDIPSKAFSYSTVETSPSFAVAPAVTSLVKEVPSKAFSYSTVESSPSVAVAPAVTSYPVVSLVKGAPAKAVSYSTVATSPSVSLVSAPVAVTYSIADQKVPVVSTKFIPESSLDLIPLKLEMNYHYTSLKHVFWKRDNWKSLPEENTIYPTI
jgi:hypothetical protein